MIIPLAIGVTLWTLAVLWFGHWLGYREATRDVDKTFKCTQPLNHGRRRSR